jgi:hypothetical protein
MPLRPKQKSLKSDGPDQFFKIADLFLTCSRSASWLILFSLRRKPLTVPEFSQELGMSQKKALAELERLQSRSVLISFSKSGRTYYRLADIRILRALDLIDSICQKKIKQSKIKSPAMKTSPGTRRPRD